MGARALCCRFDSVQQDWRALLGEAPASLFTVHAKELENSHLMFSLSLNEAMNLHLKGESEKACPELEMVEFKHCIDILELSPINRRWNH